MDPLVSSDSPSSQSPPGVSSPLHDAAKDKVAQQSAIDHLQSAAQRDLMDAIDRLRSQLSRELDLPQLVVCGNQSAGKSSVLEAIAHVAFPTGQETTTRFATEIVLRRAGQSRTAVSIQPAPNTPPQEEQRLQQFSADMQSLENVPGVVKEAQEYILKGPPAKHNFCEHRLRVEVSGPNQPHLTLVDLPGLIANTSTTATKSDIQTITDLNKFYLQQPRSIILAVMSAQNDYLTQPIFEMARDIDPTGRRTMGILTKPDLVERRTEEPRIRLLRNEGDAVLDLGWHVLRNRNKDLEGVSPERRDDEEAAFFENMNFAWSRVPDDLRGIRSLRQKLSKILFDTITLSLPEITREINNKLDDCSQKLQKLGQPRPETWQRRHFLTSVTSRLRSLIDQALACHYRDPFFTSKSAEVGHIRRLGTRLAIIADTFTANMTRNGERFHIVKDDTFHCSTHKRSPIHGSFTFSFDEQPQCVTESVALKAAMTYVAQNKSRRLPGDTPVDGDADIFKVQCQSWEAVALDYVGQCVLAVSHFFQLALDHVAPSYTAQMIMQHAARSKIDQCRLQANAKVRELVTPFKKSFITTQNPTYQTKLGIVIEALGLKEDNQSQRPLVLLGKDAAAATTILNKVKAYYPVALYNFIDNVISLAIENCVVEPLRSVFEAEEVSMMDDERLELIGSEPPKVVQERERDLKRLDVLQEVFQVCNRYSNASYATGATTGAAGNMTGSQTDQYRDAQSFMGTSSANTSQRPTSATSGTRPDALSGTSFRFADTSAKFRPSTDSTITTPNYSRAGHNPT